MNGRIKNPIPVVTSLIIFSFVGFLITQYLIRFNLAVFQVNSLHYLGSISFLKHPWQIITHLFLFTNILHLTIASLVLAFFGNMLEKILGSKYFLFLLIFTSLGGILIDFIYQLSTLYSSTGIMFLSISEQMELASRTGLNVAKNINIHMYIERISYAYNPAIYGIITAYLILQKNVNDKIMPAYLLILLLLTHILFAIFISIFLTPNNNETWSNIGGAVTAILLVNYWINKGVLVKRKTTIN